MSPATRKTTDPVRRIAWVSYGLALACVAGFFFAKSATLEADAAMAGHLVSAEEYFRAHPYLEPPPILERHIPRVQIERHEAELPGGAAAALGAAHPGAHPDA